MSFLGPFMLLYYLLNSKLFYLDLHRVADMWSGYNVHINKSKF